MEQLSDSRALSLSQLQPHLISPLGQAVFIQGVKSKVINTVCDCHVHPIFLDLSFFH